MSSFLSIRKRTSLSTASTRQHWKHAKVSIRVTSNDNKLPVTQADVMRKETTKHASLLQTKLKKSAIVGKMIRVIIGSFLVLFALLHMGILHTLSPAAKKGLGNFSSRTWQLAERIGLFEPLPKLFNLQEDYLPYYPNLKLLDDNWQIIQSEVVELLKLKGELGGLHQLGVYFKQDKPGKDDQEWRQFFLKMGKMIAENRQWMPQTYDLVQRVPEIQNLYISILEPHVNVPPHWKYYKGMVKYHLGIIIPNNNANKEVFLRLDPSVDNTPENKHLNHFHQIAPSLDAPQYFWHNGEGVVWDDMLYHEVKNGADGVRVIVLADVERYLPWYLKILNRMQIYIAFRDPDVQEMQRNCVFTGKWEDHEATATAFEHGF